MRGKRDKADQPSDASAGALSSIAPPKPDAADSEKKSPWNSLELAKILMAAATPLALFLLGYIVARQNVEETTARDQAARAETAVRERQARTDTALRDRAARDEAYVRERALRAEGFEREKSLRDEAFRHEAATRQDALQRDRFERLAQKRMEFWEKLSPRLAAIDRHVADAMRPGGQIDRGRIQEIRRDCDDLFILYRPFITPGFRNAYSQYLSNLNDLAELLENPRTRSMPGFEYLSQAFRSHYEGLILYAAQEVASASGFGSHR